MGQRAVGFGVDVYKHPLSEFVEIATLIIVTCVTNNIVILAIIWLGSLFLRGKKLQSLGISVMIIIITISVNLLTNHRGETYLFYLGDNIVTLESGVYGFVLGLQLSTLVILCMYLSARMTADKIVIITSYIAPSLGLLISMSIRSFERYSTKGKEIYSLQKSESNEESFFSNIKAGIRAVSILITWSLENGLEMADSMKCRGYGSTKRTAYNPVRFKVVDGIICSIMTGFMIMIIAFNDNCMYTPYIDISINLISVLSTFTLVIYGVVQSVLYRRKEHIC